MDVVSKDEAHSVPASDETEAEGKGETTGEL
jgi:hypothetical protein